MRIRVTAENILRGVRRSEKRCPLARAGEDAGLEEVEVAPLYSGRWQVYYRSNGRRVSLDLPDDAQARVIHYDQTGQMSPFDFEIEVK